MRYTPSEKAEIIRLVETSLHDSIWSLTTKGILKIASR